MCRCYVNCPLLPCYKVQKNVLNSNRSEGVARSVNSRIFVLVATLTAELIAIFPISETENVIVSEQLTQMAQRTVMVIIRSSSRCIDFSASQLQFRVQPMLTGLLVMCFNRNL